VDFGDRPGSASVETDLGNSDLVRNERVHNDDLAKSQKRMQGRNLLTLPVLPMHTNAVTPNFVRAHNVAVRLCEYPLSLSLDNFVIAIENHCSSTRSTIPRCVDLWQQVFAPVHRSSSHLLDQVESTRSWY
jgi:hypothetical protein